VKFKGIDSRNASEPLKGLQLYLAKDTLAPLEENQFYQADLLGVTVKSIAGEVIGAVESVQNYGAGDLLEIKLTSSRRLILVPFTSWAIPLVDLKAKELVVDAKVLQDLTDTRQPDNVSPERTEDGY
jgi:16S rRNA processing protein RimM